jgi:PadR family transcriptional regulator PadR
VGQADLFSCLNCIRHVKRLTQDRSYVYIVDMAELLGTFEQIVMLAVLGLDDGAYGRAVLREAQMGSGPGRSISAGAVYSTLDRLEAKGLLCSRIEDGTPSRGGRVRRFYRVTSAGAQALDESRRALEKMWQGKKWPLEVSA